MAEINEEQLDLLATKIAREVTRRMGKEALTHADAARGVEIERLAAEGVDHSSSEAPAKVNMSMDQVYDLIRPKGKRV